MRDLGKKRAYAKQHYRDNWLHYQEYHRKYATENRKQKNLNNIKYNRKIKLEVLSHYGGVPPVCACCDERAIEFLTIDHIEGGGNKHRREIGRRNIYSYLKKGDWPLGFRVLCMNCNFALGHFGYCPHEEGVHGHIQVDLESYAHQAAFYLFPS